MCGACRSASCSITTIGEPRQIVQTKNLMLITSESNYGLRYIYMDGRPAPNNDPTPWWFGYSRG